MRAQKTREPVSRTIPPAISADGRKDKAQGRRRTGGTATPAATSPCGHQPDPEGLRLFPEKYSPQRGPE